MGFLKNLIRNAIGEGISRGVSDAVGKATEKIVAPKAEEVATKTANELEEVSKTIDESKIKDDWDDIRKEAEEFAGDMVFSGIWSNFPKWTLSQIQDVSHDEGDEYVLQSITVDLTDELVEQYSAILSQSGFTGDWQMMSKEAGGFRYIVDFSFVPDSQIQYMIQK